MPGETNLMDHLSTFFAPLGFECHSFLSCWYNDLITDKKFALTYQDDTFCVLIVSRPDMFEKCFLPFCQKPNINPEESPCLINDTLDICMNVTFNEAMNYCTTALKTQGYESLCDNVQIIHDYSLTPTRRPKLLVQVAAHASGAAFYYTDRLLPETDKNSLQDPEIIERLDLLKKKERVYGCVLHPQFGGWFALRGAFIFPNLKVPNLPRLPPVDVLCDDKEKIIQLLYLFNFNWQSGQYRDVHSARERYSLQQIEYFCTDPSERRRLLDTWLSTLFCS